MKNCMTFFVFGASVLYSHLVLAHPPEEHEIKKPAPEVAPSMILPRVTGPHPWSDKPVLDDPSRFHIAIMTDRTGGHRPGVWMRAVEAVNLLRPTL